MRVAVIGAGMAGLAAARALAAAGAGVEVFERGAKLGGRVSTRRHGSAAFDDGAQFIRAETPLAARILRHELPAGTLADITGDVVPFDRHGATAPGDAAQNAEPKWVVAGGLDGLGPALARGLPAVRLGWPVATMTRDTDGWLLAGPRGSAGGFGAVVLTPPAPVAAAIIDASDFDGGLRRALREALAPVSYRSILSVAFGVPGDVARPREAYALVNTDRGHTVSWLSFEHRKPGYAPPGLSIIQAQMADAWSRPRLHDAPRAIADGAWREVTSLLGDLPPPRWAEVTPWEHALPNATADAAAAGAAEGAGLFLAGDAMAGPRAHLALESGAAAAARILASGSGR